MRELHTPVKKQSQRNNESLPSYPPNYPNNTSPQPSSSSSPLSICSLFIFTVTFSILLFLFIRSVSLPIILDWVDEIGVYGNILFIVAFTIVGLPFALGGYTPLSLAAGFLYSVPIGAATITIGTMSGSIFGYITSRWILNKCVKGILSSRPVLEAFMSSMEAHGFKLILLLRMAPIPFGVQNSIFSLSGIPLLHYTVATMIGLFPEILMLTYMGNTIKNIAGIATGEYEFGLWQKIMLGVEIGVSILLFIVFIVMSRKAMQHVRNKQAEQQAKEMEESRLEEGNRIVDQNQSIESVELGEERSGVENTVDGNSVDGVSSEDREGSGSGTENGRGEQQRQITKTTEEISAKIVQLVTPNKIARHLEKQRKSN